MDCSFQVVKFFWSRVVVYLPKASLIKVYDIGLGLGPTYEL